MKLQQATDLLQRTMTGDQNLFSTFDPRTSTFSPTQTKRKRDQRSTSSQHFSQRTRTRNTVRKSPDERQLEMCMSQTIYDDIDENDTKVMANTLRDFYDLPPTNQTLASFKKLIRDQYDRNVNEDHINDVTNTLFTILKRVLAREDSLPRMLIDISAKLFGDSLVKVSKSTQVISQESQNSSFEVEEFDPHEENLKLTKTATIDISEPKQMVTTDVQTDKKFFDPSSSSSLISKSSKLKLKNNKKHNLILMNLFRFSILHLHFKQKSLKMTK